MPKGDQSQVFFGARSQGSFEVNLPRRYLSEDGLCAIDIAAAKNGGTKIDRARWEDISKDVEQIISKCVMRPSRGKGYGGIVRNVGRDGNLVVIIESYRPNVSCQEEMVYKDDGWCLWVLDKMPASVVKYEFTRSADASLANYAQGIGDGQKYTDPEGKCTGTLKFEADRNFEEGDHFEIWAAAVAVDRLCVQRDQAGVAFGIGKRGGLTMALGPS